MDGSGVALLAHSYDQLRLEDDDDDLDNKPLHNSSDGSRQKRKKTNSLVKNGRAMLKNKSEGPSHQPTVSTPASFNCFCAPCGGAFSSIARNAVLALDHFPHLGADDSLEIGVLSYNLFIRPPGIKNNDDDYKEERLDDFISVMDEFDIIGLQEMFSTFSSRVQKLIDAAFAKGFYYHLKSKPHGALSSFLVDGGLLLLSKYPIVEDDGIIYSQGVQSDGLASKGVVYAKIQVSSTPDSCIHFFLTHTQASYLDGNPVAAQRSLRKRNEQLKELKQFVEKKILTPHNIAIPGRPATYRRLPAIVLGDLNVNGRKEPGSHEDSEEYHEMMQILRSEHYAIIDLLKEETGHQPITFGDVIQTEKGLQPRETALTCKEDWGSRQRLDYTFFVKPHPLPSQKSTFESFSVAPSSTRVEHFFVSNKPYIQMSDHYGVSTRLRYHKLPKGELMDLENKTPGEPVVNESKPASIETNENSASSANATTTNSTSDDLNSASLLPVHSINGEQQLL